MNFPKCDFKQKVRARRKLHRRGLRYLRCGELLRRAACENGLEGVVSKRIEAPYKAGERGTWVKSKCLNLAEFVIVGWTDPEGSRSAIGALLLGYYTPDARLLYSGRVGTGMSEKTLRILHMRLKPLAVAKMPLDEKPPRKAATARL